MENCYRHCLSCMWLDLSSTSLSLSVQQQISSVPHSEAGTFILITWLHFISGIVINKCILSHALCASSVVIIKWNLLLSLLRKVRLCGTTASNVPFVHPSSDDTWVNMEQRWNDIDRGKPKDSEKNRSQCHFVHQKFHIDCPDSEARRLKSWTVARPTSQLTNWLNNSMEQSLS
jgi:hypothetical protein